MQTWNDLGVNAGTSPVPGLGEIRQYHLSRLNQALRRPGMWGRELTIRLFMDATAFVEGMGTLWKQEQDELRTRGAFNALGVHGAFTAMLPGYLDDGAAVASVYAETVWRLGWLSVDRALPDEKYQRLSAESGRWSGQDHRLDDIRDEFGPPSALFGPSSPWSAKTLAYAPATHNRDLVCLHFAGTNDSNAPQSRPEAQPVLVAARYGRGAFIDTFTFTPAGAVYRRTGENYR